MRWFALGMSVTYIALGGVLLFTQLGDHLISEQRKLFGGLLLGYGLFRGFLWWKRWRTDSKAV